MDPYILSSGILSAGAVITAGILKLPIKEVDKNGNMIGNTLQKMNGFFIKKEICDARQELLLEKMHSVNQKICTLNKKVDKMETTLSEKMDLMILNVEKKI